MKNVHHRYPSVDAFYVWAIFDSRDEAEAVLSGWADQCTGPGSLEWIRVRLVARDMTQPGAVS